MNIQFGSIERLFPLSNLLGSHPISTNGKQYCKVTGVSSKTEEIKCGVPQGSCLGTLLFLIYTNGLPFSLKKVKVTMYADDTSISYPSKSMEDINQTLNNELGHLTQWLQGNKLSFNVPVVGSQTSSSGRGGRGLQTHN